MTILTYAFRFLTEGIPLFLGMLPVYTLWRITVWQQTHTRYRLTFRIDGTHEFFSFVLFCCLMLLFTQTFKDYGQESDLRLIPFQVIIDQIRLCSQSMEDYQEFVLNILGNVAAFVPIGWLTAILTGGDFRKTALYGFEISLFIEVMQLPLNRTSDVDDLILNTTGAVVGYACYQLTKAVTKKLSGIKCS